MRLKLDLHVHSNYSRDGVSPIETIVKRIIEIGFDGFALTDHDTIDGINEASNMDSELLIIPGMEISARGAHILALDIQDRVEPHQVIGETVDSIHEQGGIAVLAHPYAIPRSFLSIERVRGSNFDAIEVANGSQFPYSMVKRLNARMASKLSLPETGGSDSHIPETVGRCYTIVDSDSKERGDVMDAIKRGSTEVGGRGISLVERLKKYQRLYVWRSMS